jgi:hypothetical protein
MSPPHVSGAFNLANNPVRIALYIGVHKTQAWKRKSEKADRRRQAAETQRIMNAFRRLVHELRVYSRATEKKYGLSLAQLFVLQRLSDVPSLSPQ